MGRRSRGTASAMCLGCGDDADCALIRAVRSRPTRLDRVRASPGITRPSWRRAGWRCRARCRPTAPAARMIAAVTTTAARPATMRMRAVPTGPSISPAASGALNNSDAAISTVAKTATGADPRGRTGYDRRSGGVITLVHAYVIGSQARRFHTSRAARQAPSAPHPKRGVEHDPAHGHGNHNRPQGHF